MNSTLNKVAANDVRAGKYLTFKVSDENYAVEILKVREIIGLIAITRIPRLPEYIRGVIDLRGQIIPVMELRNKFEMPAVEDTKETCIIVVEIGLSGQSVLTGLVVDSVSEVLDIKEDQIEDTPQFGAEVNTDFILGIGNVKNEVVILLNINKIVNIEEFADIQSNHLSRETKSRIENEKLTVLTSLSAKKRE